MNTLVHTNPHIPTEEFRHMMTVESPPPEMVANLGRICYLKLVQGMTNPKKANINGVPVTPMWTHGSKSYPTNRPRLFKIKGLQKNYKGDICYRIYAQPGDEFGRCAQPSEVIFLEEDGR